MKLTFVSCLTQNCGIGRYTHELAANCHNRSFDVTLYRKDGGEESYIKSYPYRSFRQFRHYVAPFYLSRALKPETSDIWHADYVDAGWALSLAGKKSQPVVVTAHDAIPFLHSKSTDLWVYKYELKQSAAIADAIVVVSENSKNDLLRFTSIPEHKIYVVHNGINHHMFYPDAEPSQNEVFTIRYIGGLAKHKNVETLLRAAKILEDKQLNIMLEIGGGGYQQTQLPQLAKELGLKTVAFKGFIPNERLRAYLSTADLFVYPSLYEGFGFPPLEAMACGAPTLSSNCGSLTEVMQQGALCCEPTPKVMAEHIMALYNHPEKRHELRQKALETASGYTWEKTTEKNLQIYQKLM